MKLKTLYELITGKRDIRSLKILNQIFGKKCLFVEKPHIFMKNIERYLLKNKVKEIFILTPENYKDMIKAESSEITKAEFEEYFNRIITIARKRNISLILHVHLKKHTSNIPFEEKHKRTRRALKYLTDKKLKIREVGFGWWRFSHEDPELKIVANKLGLKLSKRRFHIYDFWLNE